MRNSCTTRSTSSVVTPGLQCSPASTTACAASRPATRIRSTISGVCTVRLDRVGSFLPTYSGRGIDAGTSRQGESSPGTKALLLPIASTVTGARRRSGQGRQAVDAVLVLLQPVRHQVVVALAGGPLGEQ